MAYDRLTEGNNFNYLVQEHPCSKFTLFIYDRVNISPIHLYAFDTLKDCNDLLSAMEDGVEDPLEACRFVGSWKALRGLKYDVFYRKNAWTDAINWAVYDNKQHKYIIADTYMYMEHVYGLYIDLNDLQEDM